MSGAKLDVIVRGFLGCKDAIWSEAFLPRNLATKEFWVQFGPFLLGYVKRQVVQSDALRAPLVNNFSDQTYDGHDIRRWVISDIHE